MRRLVVDNILHNMGLFDLAETQPCVSQADVFEVVFLGATDVFSTLNVVTTSLLDEERIFEIPYVCRNGVGALSLT